MRYFSRMPRNSTRFLALAILLACGMTGYYFGIFLPRVSSIRASKQLDGGYFEGGDFYPLWLTSVELRRARVNPYTETMTRQIQVGLYGRPLDPARSTDPPPNYRSFSYPLFADLLIWPTAMLSFPQARILLAIVFVPIALFTAWTWMNAFPVNLPPFALAAILLFYVTSYPLLETLVALQPTLLVAALLAVSMWALARHRYWLAGVILALATIKPQLSALVTVWVLLWSVSAWQRRKGAALGFSLALFTLLAASQLVLPGWLHLWINSLLDYRQYTPPPLTQLVMGRVIGFGVGIGLFLIAAVVTWRTRYAEPRTDEFNFTVALLLGVSVVLFPSGDAVYEHILLLPALLFLGLRRREFLDARGPRRLLAYLLISALLWQWIMAWVLVAARVLTPSVLHNMSTVLIPLRLAAPLPFLVLVLLGYHVAPSMANLRKSASLTT